MDEAENGQGLDPIWNEPAVITTTWRFEAAGQVWFVQWQDGSEDEARGLLNSYTGGLYPDAVATLYAPTNLELEQDWSAGGFTVLSRA